MKTQKYRIVIRCGFYIVQREVPRFFGWGRMWDSFINNTGTSLFASMSDATAFLNKEIEGKAFVYGSRKATETGEFQIEIIK